MAEPLCCQWLYKERVVNHLFKVESSNVVAPEVNYDLICISFPLVIRNNNVLIRRVDGGCAQQLPHTTRTQSQMCGHLQEWQRFLIPGGSTGFVGATIGLHKFQVSF